MDQVCPHCSARFWNKERNTQGLYTTCCSKGEVKLSPISKPPPYVNSLLQGQTVDAKAFKSNPRIFNTKVSFASVSLNTEELRPGVPTLRMSGCIYHRISDIIPIPGAAPQCTAEGMYPFIMKRRQFPVKLLSLCNDHQ